MGREPDLDADLDAFLIGDEWPPDEPPPVPDDAAGASHLLLAISSRRRRVEQHEAHAAERIEEIEAWRDDRTAGLLGQIKHIERSLSQWMRAHHAATGTATVNLPDGVLKLRAGRSSIVAFDDAAGDWAEAHDAARVKVALDKKALGSLVHAGPALCDPAALSSLGEAPETHEWCVAVTEDGEVVPGLAVLEPIARVFGYETNRSAIHTLQQIKEKP